MGESVRCQVVLALRVKFRNAGELSHLLAIVDGVAAMKSVGEGFIINQDEEYMTLKKVPEVPDGKVDGN